MIYDSGNRCPNCGSEEHSDNFKGKVVVLNTEQSEIAKNSKIANRKFNPLFISD